MSSIVLYNCRRCHHSVIDWLMKFCDSLPYSRLASFRRRIQIVIQDKLAAAEPPTQHNPLDWCPGCWGHAWRSPSWLQTSSSTFAMLADVLADLGRPLPAARSAFPLASIRFSKLLNSLLDQPFDGNSFNSFLEPHLLCFRKFSIKIYY